MNRIIPEDSPVGAVLGEPIAATDPEDDSLTYTLSGEGSDLFNVSNQGQISLSVTLNYEDNTPNEDNTPTYSLTLSVRDNKDEVGNPNSETDASITVSVAVGDVDEPPGSVDPVTVCVLSTSELLVEWSRALNTGPYLTYQVQYREQGKSDWTDLDFGDDANETTIPNLDTNTTYQVRVRAMNDEGEGPWAEGIGATERAQLTVAFGPTAFTVDEGDTATTTVMITPVADRDVTVTITMTGSGATLSGLDMGNKLIVMCGQSSRSFIVSGDQDGDAIDGEVSLALGTNDDKVSLDNSATITIIDDDKTNLPPQFATTTVNLSILENLPVGTLLGDPISATDPEGDPLTYSLSGEGSQYFEVSYQGQLMLSASLNHEVAPSYTLIMSVSDSKDGIGNPDSATDASITINVKVEDVDEPPDAPTGVTVSANAENPTTALDVSWTAPDTAGIPAITGYDMQYRELGQDAWIEHGFSGTGTETTIRDLDTGTAYEVWVRAKNDEGKSGWSTPGSAVTDTPELGPELTPQPVPRTGSSPGGGGSEESNTAPRFNAGNVTLRVNENSAEGFHVGSPVIAKDSDADDRITYSLSGDAAAFFRVDLRSGQITVAGELDFETKGTYFVTMIATDRGGLEDEIDITIEVRNVDEPGAVTLSPGESETNRTITAKLTDPDGSISEVIWQWQTSSDGTVWADVEGASSPSYTPVSDDETKRLRVTASYTDGHGPDKTVESTVTSPVLPSPDLDATVLAEIATEADAGDVVRLESESTDNPVQVDVRVSVPGWVTHGHALR